jgi:hypothetical protein
VGMAGIAVEVGVQVGGGGGWRLGHGYETDITLARSVQDVIAAVSREYLELPFRGKHAARRRCVRQ